MCWSPWVCREVTLPDQQKSRATKALVAIYGNETLRKNVFQDLWTLSWRNNLFRKDGADWKDSPGFTDSSYIFLTWAAWSCTWALKILFGRKAIDKLVFCTQHLYHGCALAGHRGCFWQTELASSLPAVSSRRQLVVKSCHYPALVN